MSTEAQNNGRTNFFLLVRTQLLLACMLLTFFMTLLAMDASGQRLERVWWVLDDLSHGSRWFYHGCQTRPGRWIPPASPPPPSRRCCYKARSTVTNHGIRFHELTPLTPPPPPCPFAFARVRPWIRTCNCVCSGIVLHSPILSGMRVLTESRALSCLDIYPNVDRVSRVQCPVMVMHGMRDEEVGFHR